MQSAYGNYGGSNGRYSNFQDSFSMYNQGRPAADRSKFLDVHELLKAEMQSQGNIVDSVNAASNQPIVDRISFDRTASANGMPSEFGQVTHRDNFANSRMYAAAAIGAGMYPNGISPKDLPQEVVSKLAAMSPMPVQPPLPIPTDLIAKLSEKIGIDDRYVFCDSQQKQSDSDPSQGLYVYDVSKINNNFPIKTIISADIGSFRIPRIETDPVFQPNYQYFRRVMVDIEPLSVKQQVNTGIQQRNFVFEFEVINDGLGFILQPIKNTVYFSPPLNSFDSLRFRFKVPYQRYMTFEQDVFTMEAVIPAPGPPPADRRIRTFSPMNLPFGSTQSIWITNYNSANQTLNNTLNNENGLEATVIDAYTLQLTNVPNANLIATTFTSTGSIPTGIVSIGSRRIAFQLRLRTLTDKYTNFILPS